MAHWINKMSLDKHSEPLNRESERIGELINQPKAFLYIDRKNPTIEAESNIALAAL
jgi:hypothetical protein